MRYRPHRGGLADAMAEAVEVSDWDGLLLHLGRAHPEFGPPFDPNKVFLSEDGHDDPRIGWTDVHYVMHEGWDGPLGMCEAPLGWYPIRVDGKLADHITARAPLDAEQVALLTDPEVGPAILAQIDQEMAAEMRAKFPNVRFLPVR